MIARSFILAVCVVVLSPGLSPAQPDTKGGALIPAGASASTADRKLYEDIEILRRIFDRKLHTLYPSHTWPNMGGMMGFQGGMSGTQVQGGMMGMGGMGMGGMGMGGMGMGGMGMGGMGMGGMGMGGMGMGGMGMGGMGMGGMGMGGMNPIVIPTRTLEGVYLKGQGVVYTVTLSSLQLAAKVETAKPVSEWESVRREFRKEKETPKKSGEGKAAGLREVLLKVLAENGHHFARLGENESLTIVVTVHEESQSRPPRKSGSKVSNSFTLTDSASGSSKTHDLEVLGDLHLKQAHYEDAIAAFRKAVEWTSGSKQKAALHRKLAQAYLMQEKNEEARSHLDQAIALALLKEAADAKSKPILTAKSAAASLPVKMIISVPKNLLDRAGEGKMTFEEFCRRASVETLQFEGSQR